MSSHYLVPTFNKGGFFSNPNKVHKDLAVSGQHTVSHPEDVDWISAIATESIPATVDGEYVFAVRVDNIVNAYCLIGVTPMETFDSSQTSYPGRNGMTGCALDLRDGNYMPGNGPILVDATITTKAKEIIVVVTIVNSGAQKLIRWIVDGTSSDINKCTADCIGDKLFPVVTMYSRSQQVTTIPIKQITIRNEEIYALIDACEKQSSSSANQSKAAAANIINQQQTSSAAFAQLQQEIEKERQRADLAETQLQQELQNSAAKDHQLQLKDAEIERLRQLLKT